MLEYLTANYAPVWLHLALDTFTPPLETPLSRKLHAYLFPLVGGKPPSGDASIDQSLLNCSTTSSLAAAGRSIAATKGKSAGAPVLIAIFFVRYAW